MQKFLVTDKNIIFEDEILLVANKPAGLPCQGTDDEKKDHFYAALMRYLKGEYLAIHHRLDAPTSGLMIFSKSRSYNKEFTELFRQRKIHKTYLALVEGKPLSVSEWRYESKLRKIRKGRFLMTKEDESGELAITNFKIINTLENQFLLACFPETGRMHQLRVQLAAQRMPIVGDWIYGKGKKEGRLMLHAWKLSFPHPKTGDLLSLEAPIPFEFEPFAG